MTRPDDEFPPLDVTSTLNLGSLDEVLEGPDTDVVPSRMSGSLPPGMALLVVRRGPNAGARFLLDHDVTTSGRHPDSDIFLDDVTVSRRHAEFHRDGRPDGGMADGIVEQVAQHSCHRTPCCPDTTLC